MINQRSYFNCLLLVDFGWSIVFARDSTAFTLFRQHKDDILSLKNIHAYLKLPGTIPPANFVEAPTVLERKKQVRCKVLVLISKGLRRSHVLEPRYGPLFFSNGIMRSIPKEAVLVDKAVHPLFDVGSGFPVEELLGP